METSVINAMVAQTSGVSELVVETWSITDILICSIIGISIVVLTLFALQIMILIMSKIVSLFVKNSPSVGEKTTAPKQAPAAVSRAVSRESGSTSGEIEIMGADESTAAVIMATVSHHMGIPMENLKIKSIKKI